MIDLNKHFVPNSDKFISSDLGNEVMLMNLDTGDYIALNSVSAEIYKLAAKKMTLSQIINILLEKYHVQEPDCTRQVLQCVQSMMEKELLA